MFPSSNPTASFDFSAEDPRIIRPFFPSAFGAVSHSAWFRGMAGDIALRVIPETARRPKINPSRIGWADRLIPAALGFVGAGLLLRFISKP